MDDYSKFKVIWYFLRHHKRYIIALLAISFFIAATGAFNISLVYTILNWGLGIDASEVSIFSRLGKLIILNIPVDDRFIGACILFLSVATLFCIFMYLEVMLRATLAVKITMSTKVTIFKKFVDSPYQYFIDNKQGDLLYRAGQAPEQLASIYFAIATIVSHLIFSLFLLWAMFTISASVTLTLAGLGLVYYFFTQYIGYKHLYFFGKKTTEAGQSHSIVLNEFFTGIRSIRVNGFEEGWTQKVKEVLKKRFYYHKKTKLWEGFPDILLRWFFYSCMGLVAIIIRIRYPESFISIMPTFGAITFAVLNLVPKLSSLGLYKMRISTALPELELVYKTLTEKSKRDRGGKKEFNALNQAIQFENVYFSHKNRNELLKGISIVLEEGKMIAIVGESGSGKSTIAHLLIRLFKAKRGRISVDGENLNNYEVDSWLDKVGFVDQDVFIYNATIKENIVFGLESYQQEDLVNSARIANIHDFIVNLPKGYDTVVGDRGLKLSGGEKQRVAIARAVLRNPQIMIFDEATASLDNFSESLVQGAINNTLKGRTVIVIAHRLSTIQNADKIIVIDKGRIAEEGIHEELINRKGAYWRLYNLQAVNNQTQSDISTTLGLV